MNKTRHTEKPDRQDKNKVKTDGESQNKDKSSQVSLKERQKGQTNRMGVTGNLTTFENRESRIPGYRGETPL